ncbi:MAG: energy transducer TonB [Terriglobia bacterium]
MFDATLLDSSPARAPVLTAWHWVAGFCMGILGGLTGYVVLPFLFPSAPMGLIAESVLLGIGLMFYEMMIWYVLADARHLQFSIWKWSLILLLLNVVGFLAYLIYSGSKTGDWKRAALPIAYLFEGIVVCCLLLFPLIVTQALPDSRWSISSIPPPPPSAPPAAKRSGPRATKHVTAHATITEPIIIPAHIFQIKESQDVSQITPPNIAYVPGAIEVGPGSGHGAVLFGSSTQGTPPPPPVTTKASVTRRIHLTSVVEQAKLIFHPSPVYPSLAIIARIQGTVLLDAVISKDGTIQDLKAVSGHPLLIRSAMDAVAHWRYQPTLLNGDPVEVGTEVQVKFILGD